MRPIAYRIEMGHDRLVWECQTCQTVLHAAGPFAKVQVASTSSAQGHDQRFDRPKSFREGIDRGGIVAFVIKFAPGVNLGR
jgi:hypothetical protein